MTGTLYLQSRGYFGGPIRQAKGVLDEAGVKYHVVELDLKSDTPTGAEIQSALASATGKNDWMYRFDPVMGVEADVSLVGRRTVPNVFIKRESIGGGTDVQALFQSGKLTEMLRTAGVL
ncbi:unnamed protein product [Phytophthora fragariaefolia]|uniref:Unnamed protein product n=1 Tax=Phytophthora fragariaefolia TaxID=1490495 RepID=A0A9W6TUP4_9STRA|nr:unnamed protein product [Phytophthora fragariaefolia]